MEILKSPAQFAAELKDQLGVDALPDFVKALKKADSQLWTTSPSWRLNVIRQLVRLENQAG